MLKNRSKKWIVFVVFFLLFFSSINNLFLPLISLGNDDRFFFSAVMLLPTSGPIQWHERHPDVFPDAFAEIGIDLQQDWVSWAALGPRATRREVGDYREGGYDICYFGMSLGTPFNHPISSLKGVFGKESIPPYGFNVMYWSDLNESYMTYRANEQNLLLENISNELNLSSTKKLVDDWIKIWYDVMPNILISTQLEVHAIGNGVYGYDPVDYPFNSIESYWVDEDEFLGDDPHTMIFVPSTSGASFNTLIATDVYDIYSASPPMDGLVGHTPSKELVLPVGTDRDTWMTEHYGTTDYLALYPRVAAEIGYYSENGLQYNLTIRDDVYWHDGHLLDAWDVAFSFQARLIPTIGKHSNLLVPMGYDDRINYHGNYSFIVDDKDQDTFYESISFNLNTTFVPFQTNHLGMDLFPEHILGDPVNHGFTGEVFDPVNRWIVPPEDWDTHSYNTGNPADPGGLNGPLGCGPVIFKEYDPTSQNITLEKFEDIKWENSTSDWVEAPGISHWNIGSLDMMPEQVIIISPMSMSSAITAMKTGNIQVIDPRLITSYEELVVEDAVQTILSPETGWNAIWLNPKFTVNNGDCPFNQKGVRHAVSHIIPREAIIDIRGGFFQPAFSPLPVNSWYAIDPDDLLNFKKFVQANDGTYPEMWETTAYDSYNVSTARAWMASEGYSFSTLATDTTGKPNQFFSPLYVDPRLVIFALVITSLVIVHIKGKNRKEKKDRKW